jgi:hypothetical protein
MSSIVRFSSWKLIAAHLADHARDELVGRLGEWVALRPGGQVLGALLDPEEAVGVQAQGARAQVGERVERVADDQAHAREGRVEPVDRGLAGLEVMQVHPAPSTPSTPLTACVALQFVSLTPGS